MVLRIGLYAFDGVEVLDLAGPYEVFTTAARVQAKHQLGLAPVLETVIVAQHAGPIRTRPGLVLNAEHGFTDVPAIDVLIIPGGVVEAELARPEVLAWIATTAGRARLTASVCTGAFLLAAAGRLDDREVTTHWEDISDLQTRFPSVKVRQARRWIDTGDIVTSAGISAGIDMSLHLVGRLCGEPLALATARQMEYAWQEGDALASAQQ